MLRRHDLGLDDECIVPNVSRVIQDTERQKFHVAEALVVPGGGGPLEGCQGGLGHQRLHHVGAELTSGVLVQNAQHDPPAEWPLQDIVKLTLHEMNKYGKMGSSRRVYSVQICTNTYLISKATRIKRRTMNGCHFP